MNVISGGGDDIINAFTKYHGPSWRMVVELTDKINAYAIYPGGQDGNPGSKYYDHSSTIILQVNIINYCLLPKANCSNKMI